MRKQENIKIYVRKNILDIGICCSIIRTGDESQNYTINKLSQDYYDKSIKRENMFHLLASANLFNTLIKKTVKFR